MTLPQNPLVGANFKGLCWLDELERKLRPHWGEVPRTVEGRLGQILISAIIHGGLVAPQTWGPWIERVQSPQFQIEGPPYIEFGFKSENGRSARRRWFADPLTAALLRRWRQARFNRNIQLSSPENLIQDYCRTVGVEVHEGAAAFTGWFPAAAALRLRLRVPGVLADYAVGIEHSSAVAQPIWKSLSISDPELFTFDPAAADISKLHVDLTLASKQKRYWYYRRSSGPIAPLLGPLSSARARGEMNRRGEALLVRSTVKKLLGTRTQSGLLDRAPRTVREAVYNLFGLLSYSRRRKGEVRLNKVRLSTQWNYLNALARYDWGDCWTRRFEDAPPDLMHSIFDAVVSVAKNQERSARSVLRKLDDYICHHWTHLKPWPNRDQWPDSSAGVAEILSGAQFCRALRLIDELSVEPRHRLMIRLAAILMFRAGIRGREVRHLRIGDLDHHSELFELTVRLNDDVTLKSLSSYRRLPLDILLEQEEQGELIAWHRRRMVETRGDTTQLLFPACKGTDTEKHKRTEKDKNTEEPCTDAALLHPLEQILAVLLHDSDANARIHHRRYALGTTLRHSFCTYLLATLLLPEDPGGLTLPNGIGPELVSLNRKHRVSERLLGQGRLGQSAVHAVSTLMGHAHMSRLLNCYAHLLDWSLAAYLHRRSAQIALQPSVLQALVSPSPTLDSIRKRTQRRLAAEDQAAASTLEADQSELFLAIAPPTRLRRSKGRPRAHDEVSGSCFLDHFAEPQPREPAYRPWLPPRASVPEAHLLDVAAAVVTMADRGVAASRIAELLAMDSQTLSGFLARANAIADLTARRASSSDSASLPPSAFQPVLNARGWLRSDQPIPLDIKMAAERSSIDTESRLRAALIRVVCRPRQPAFQFRKKERAEAFVDALHRLGIPRDCIKAKEVKARSGVRFPHTGEPGDRTRVRLSLDPATRFGLALLVAHSSRISIEALCAPRRGRRDEHDTRLHYRRAA